MLMQLSKKNDIKTVSSLFALEQDAWLQNAAVHLVSKGAMRAWVCREAEPPLLAVLPDQRQVRDFTADSETLSLFMSKCSLSCLSLTMKRKLMLSKYAEEIFWNDLNGGVAFWLLHPPHFLLPFP